MSKKLISFALTLFLVASLGIFSTMSVSAADTVYYDVDFDDPNCAIGSWYNADGTKAEIGFSAFDPVNKSMAQDTFRSTKAAKIDLSDAEVGTNAAKARIECQTDFLESDILWFEASVKFEGQFLQFGVENGGSAERSAFAVNQNGELVNWVTSLEGNTVEGTALKQLQLNEWYHIAVSMDYSKADSNNPICQVWLNGERIMGYDHNSGWKIGQGYNARTRWSIKKLNEGDAIIWLDNIRCYTTQTATANDTHVADYYQAATLTDGNALDAITVSGTEVVVPANATLAEIEAGLSVDGAMIFAKDGAVATDTADSIYVNAANGVGLKKYTVTYSDTVTASDIVYYDVDFENGTAASWQDAGKDTASAMQFYAQIPESKEIAQDALKSNQAIKMNLASTDTNPRARIEYNKAPFEETGVLWIETSVKFEGQFTRFGVENAGFTTAFFVDSQGQLKNFMWNIEGSDGGSAAALAQLELGEWYHIAVSMDYTNVAASSNNPICRVWLNGTCVMGWDHSSGWKVNSGNNSRLRFSVMRPASGNATVWLDNMKAYSTSVATADDTHVADYYADTVLTDANTEDKFTVSGDVVTVPLTATLSEIEAAFTTNGTMIFVKDGATATDTADSIYVNAANGVGLKKYTVQYGEKPVIYYHVNFDNGTADSWQNVGEATASGLQPYAYIPENKSLEKDTYRNSNAYKMNLSSTDTNKEARFEWNGTVDTTGVVWLEASVKFENQFVDFGVESNNFATMFFVDTNGALRNIMWDIESNAAANVPAQPIAQLELGEWYHIAVSLDYTAEAAAETYNGEYALIKTWVNGVCVQDYEFSGNYKLDGSITRTRWHAKRPAEGNTTVWLDNLRCYSYSTHDNHAETDFAGVGVADIDLTDNVVIGSGAVYTTAGYTVDDLSDAADDELVAMNGTMEIVDDTTFYLNDANGIGFKKYTICETPEFAMISGSEIKNEDGSISIYCTNETGADVAATLYFVGTDDGVLEACSMNDVSVKAGGSWILATGIEEADEYNAFLWDANLKPLSKSVSID